jgi:2-polyprenyl-3-methyl-5-hydroxy-6-metoxy-1,4-benzoquinol methylase
MSTPEPSKSPSDPNAERPELPFSGWENNRITTPVVDNLSDEDLQQLNELLPWRCFTVDQHGRRFGNLAWSGKRGVPQAMPDHRIVAWHEANSLTGKHVLEIGCFEGVHTTALCQLAERVTAIDSRIENVAKTVVRTAMFGCRPEVTTCDVENDEDLARLPSVDYVHHVGVLYHLKDPVAHLQKLMPTVRHGILLDTHVSPPDGAKKSYKSGGQKYHYHHHREGGKADVFSGMYDHAKWLLLDDLKALLQSLGFAEVEVIELRQERNGPRVRLHATRN